MRSKYLPSTYYACSPAPLTQKKRRKRREGYVDRDKRNMQGENPSTSHWILRILISASAPIVPQSSGANNGTVVTRPLSMVFLYVKHAWTDAEHLTLSLSRVTLNTALAFQGRANPRTEMM